MTEQTFAALKAVFQPLLDELVARAPVASAELPECRGLYVLSENGRCLYVGITGNLRRRWQMHRHGDMSAASFAVKLAREKTGRKRAYNESEGLRALMKDEAFRTAFKDARERIRKMEIRFVEWPGDDGDLAVFEIYAAKALNTAAYNDFSTH